MKMKLTVLSVLVFAIVSYGLYQLSYEVQQLEQDLGAIERQIVDNKESIRILKAEWAYQNRPDILQQLAQKHLPLLLIAPYQVADIKELPEIVASAMESVKVPVPSLNPRKDYSSPVEMPTGTIRLATFKLSEGRQ